MSCGPLSWLNWENGEPTRRKSPEQGVSQQQTQPTWQ